MEIKNILNQGLKEEITRDIRRQHHIPTKSPDSITRAVQMEARCWLRRVFLPQTHSPEAQVCRQLNLSLSVKILGHLPGPIVYLFPISLTGMAAKGKRRRAQDTPCIVEILSTPFQLLVDKPTLDTLQVIGKDEELTDSVNIQGHILCEKKSKYL